MSAHQITPQAAAPIAPCVLVIFGGGGDLTQRKLIPAIYHLAQEKLLSDSFAIVGVDRVEFDSASYRSRIDSEIHAFLGDEFSDAQWDALLQRIHYSQGDFADPAAYARLADVLKGVDEEQQTGGNYLFYLATPPRFFGEIATRLGTAGLAGEEDGHWRRIIIEKPFGQDLASARELNKTLHLAFNEPQIYRIDHYLGKETVQNILAYRFTNSTVEPIWNRRYIDHVEITVAESLGVETRAGYYEQAGALRDMVPNHLLALLSVIAMEPANSFSADAIRDEQTKVLSAIQPILPEQVLTQTVRGQYGDGSMPDGTRVPAYRREPGVAPDSRTETYVAMKLMIDSWRWAGIPFYLRTGKRMPGRYTEAVIQFKHAPNMMFRDSLVRRARVPPNLLVLRIQPNEGIGMSFNAKVPGPAEHLSPVEMNFSYRDYFGAAPSTGYETLLYDCMTGDAMLFKRADNIEAGWALVEPILDVWGALPPRDFPDYAAGTWGPPEADDLLRRDGRAWKACDTCSSQNA
jgi:glucose-6-phosphate 1-dehydrogenase